MSHDFATCGDDRFSVRVRRAQGSALVGSMLDAGPNRCSGFYVPRGGAVWREIDREIANADGDITEFDPEGPSSWIIIVRLRVHYAFQGSVDECIDAARRFAIGSG